MKPKLLLRLAAIIMFLHALGHTMGHLGWKQATEPAKQEIIKQMLENKFPFMGAVRSIGEYYDGYGFASTLALLLITAILWITAGSLEKDAALVKKILATVSIILLGWGIVEMIFFFPFAAVFSFLAMILTTIALFKIE